MVCTGADPGILERGGDQGPQKSRSLGIFKGHKQPPPGSATATAVGLKP